MMDTSVLVSVGGEWSFPHKKCDLIRKKGMINYFTGVDFWSIQHIVDELFV